MSDQVPQFEVTDTEGQTLHISTTAAGTSAVDVPAVAAGILSQVLLMSDPDNNPAISKVEVSFDGGVGWYPVYAGGTMTWTPKGNITQFKVRASHVGIKYYLIINRELP